MAPKHESRLLRRDISVPSETDTSWGRQTELILSEGSCLGWDGEPPSGSGDWGLDQVPHSSEGLKKIVRRPTSATRPDGSWHKNTLLSDDYGLPRM